MFYAQLLALPALLSLIMGLRWRQQLRRPRYGIPFAIVSLVLWVGAGYSIYYFHRVLPVPERRQLVAPGVMYSQEIRSFPRQFVLHIVEFNLDEAEVEFLVTPADSSAELNLKARTTTEFVKEFGVQVAINASFFTPFYSNNPVSYHPHSGDPCSAIGFCASRGVPYSEPTGGFSILNISKDNRIAIGTSMENAYNAVSGKPILVKDGELAGGLKNLPEPLNPETAVAVDRSGRKMWWIVIDGRQPNYSYGVSLVELAELCQELGAWDAIALDGGGSSTLVVQREDGRPEVLNCPIHGRHPPGRERPVANHIGAYLKKR